MRSKNELKEIDIKNCVCYYFDDIINGTKINFSNILLNKKLYENTSVYNISYKCPTGPKPLCIRFDKIDGFTILFDCKIKHLVLFDYGLLDKNCFKTKYLVSKKSEAIEVKKLKKPVIYQMIIFLDEMFKIYHALSHK